MKGHAYSMESSSREEFVAGLAEERLFSNQEEMEIYFNRLSEITDRVALINSDYQSDLNQAVTDLESFFPEGGDFLNFFNVSQELVPAFLSHMSFHREIIADIIDEGRQLLIADRREFLRRLVAYHKSFVKSFSQMEKKMPG